MMAQGPGRVAGASLLSRAIARWRREGTAAFLRWASGRTVRAARIRILKGLRLSPVTTAYGVKMVANWPDLTFMFCFKGSYGFEFASFLAGLGQDFVFLDIGANQGLYTLLACRNPRCRAAVAFEPVGRTYGLLERNIACNGCAGRAVPVRAAVSDREGRAVIRRSRGHSGAASLNRAGDGGTLETEEIALVDRRTLDGLVTGELPVVVKIDVEGHEQVVIGELLRSGFAGRIAYVFYEVAEERSDPEALRALLAGAGLVTLRRVGEGDPYDVLAGRGPERPPPPDAGRPGRSRAG